MRRAFATRALILLLCVALLALNYGGSQIAGLLAPFLVFVFTLAAWNAVPHRDPDGRGQALSFLSLDPSRAPPKVWHPHS